MNVNGLYSCTIVLVNNFMPNVSCVSELYILYCHFVFFEHLFPVCEPSKITLKFKFT